MSVDNKKSTNVVEFNTATHRFQKNCEIPTDAIKLKAPLSVIVQVTRKCNLHCVFCSESEFYEDPSFERLMFIRDQLKGVPRVFLSGGEPLLRPDMISILEAYRENFSILGLPTNSTTITPTVAKTLSRIIDYANAGLDGPRAINDLVRGKYDQIIPGIRNLVENDVPVSLSSALLKSNIDYLPQTYQIADVLGVNKFKIVVPVARGRAKQIDPTDKPSNLEAKDAFERLQVLKEDAGLKPHLAMALWGPETEGYALLVHPDGQVKAWPVFDKPDCVEVVGNLLNEDIESVWERYPYRLNHLKKYLGDSISLA